MSKQIELKNKMQEAWVEQQKHYIHTLEMDVKNINVEYKLKKQLLKSYKDVLEEYLKNN